ncbi:hypothetical protein MPTK1_3g16140 [Marchantia polymorpha subsp. ruderalis]|uniref:Steroid 5-alpha reductase C-terminal domain-containing protein n=2 Tax=Marchantia polymorpha TaxID=3197 RepID=A0AAF6B1C4_MARPO|nr:hypothetical protein MARPO_0004s0057 [Marchantia polymorpha]BBN05808.1 hypothetical protein Mp_3g16140 [Marchantia polymorpha subsp. ruderalis]|eukprot:PTQ48769.1 hypothetical protein MARPO_0004s0057 [Marchantia polymorpha]
MGHSNVSNFVLAVTVPLPSLLFYLSFVQKCDGDRWENEYWTWVCDWGRLHPLYLVNVLFFLNVDILFWVVGLVQQNVWLIDPYWTIIPVLIAHFYSAYPAAQYDLLRSRAALLLIWIWSARLTYNYFRRELWQWGKREDWRFTDIRRKDPRNWWWKSFFVCFVSQHTFLVGITLPFYSIFTNARPWNAWDGLAFLVCLSGITIAHVADTQLHSFVARNNILKDLGAPTEPLLNRGLWHYSRHPNYFGEQLFWWGLSLFSVNLGQSWAVVGTAINSACLAYTTVLVERKMVQEPSRADVYRQYQKSTSVLIPWFNRSTLVKSKTS